ncbi:winged helix-turn-helix domain-containing protein [Pseudomonas koreensis]|uniref:winged helix-turn-helix domain-containing protein n=1 Tax=Pseudomonas koreensis TaxID=198620 RepID=UPI003F84DCB4
MHFALEHDQVIFNTTQDRLQPRMGEPVKLRYLEKLLLQALLSNVNDKREIIQYVWPKTIVSDGSYHKLVFDLRKQLSLSGLDSALIKTIPRRGLVYAGQWRILEITAQDVNLSSGHPAVENASSGQKPDQAVSGQADKEEASIKWILAYSFSSAERWKGRIDAIAQQMFAKIIRAAPGVSFMYFLGGIAGVLSSMLLLDA